MRLWIGVEDFAKIKHARICVNKYTVLVGQNNSGKTFLMQLVQGVLPKLVELVDDQLVEILMQEHARENEYVFRIADDNREQVIAYFNEKLHQNKDTIVTEIFGRAIEIADLYIDFELEDEAYELRTFSNAEDNKEVLKQRLSSIRWGNQDKNVYEIVNEDSKEFSISLRIKSMEAAGMVLRQSTNGFSGELSSIQGLINDFFIKGGNLFLPASRTGLMLLYRDFFARKTDHSMSYLISDGEMDDTGSNENGLSKPVYEFLRFLQTYRQNESNVNRYREELAFFETHLIEGHISVDQQGILSYNSDNGISDVPMYLASSMINEIAPIALAITGYRNIRKLIIDEVDASLHPEKQAELVRFLNRIYNRGIQLMISTHSDTVVSKINNLYILSNKAKDKPDIVDKFGLELSDLMKADDLFVYEFLNQKNGKSIVREIEGDPQHGFQFELFTKSALHLYKESEEIGEI